MVKRHLALATVATAAAIVAVWVGGGHPQRVRRGEEREGAGQS
ncbi:hypothetical protein [Nonomuraea sp. NEAU-A123]|nr:hypothetical protein [Nonomuraea sp. NEAU-A123]